MKNTDVYMHVRGKSLFIDDIKIHNLLHAVLFLSPVAKGKIKSIDISEAAESENVKGVFTYKDIPGLNEIGHMTADQPLFAEKNLFYVGQPIAMIVASTYKDAVKARQKIKIDIEEEEPVLKPREAFEKGLIHGSQRVLVNGDTENAFKKCKYVVNGQIDSGAQEHLYFETQRAVAIPKEDDTIKVIASAQSPGKYHQHLAEVLGLPQHKIELEIRRMGGAFGGKESSAVWVISPALAAFLLQKPVKLVLDRNEDIATTGKRHPYSYDYKIGVDNNGKILAYEIDMYQHAGACADISLPVLGRSFLHATNSYKIPNIKITAVSCKTNIPPNNAFRGFGVPQAVFAVETAVNHIAEEMGVYTNEIQKKNLIQDGDSFPYGMKLEKSNADECWNILDKKIDIQNRIKFIEEYNKINNDTKKGFSVMPVCFGVSFTQTALNQASALVNIYVDGSVSVSTGAVEMGQGVNSKIAIIAANTLGISRDKVRVETTNTTRIPNASPTSASTGADLNGMATKFACEKLLKRLTDFAAKRVNLDPDDMSIQYDEVFVKTATTGFKWDKLVAEAYWARIDLSCHAFYATPGVYFNPESERGRPYAYYSFGTSFFEVTLDCIKGTYDIDSIDLVHDIGKSLSPEIDRGQIDGGVMQGIGWATMEQLYRNDKGVMLTSVNSYKIPGIKFLPEKYNVFFLENSNNPFAVCNSKAVGEPPFIHGIGAYFAILNALRNVRKDKPAPGLPLTPEKVFMYIYE
jgi:xanthine dehydrogenase large subunit